MAGHGRAENGAVSLAYVLAIHVFIRSRQSKAWMPGTSPGMTVENAALIIFDDGVGPCP
jgi:hypothetical protein